MRAGSKRKRMATDGINMTPMIDIVFQMIIFFVLTIDLDQKKFDEDIALAMAPHADPVETQHPNTIFIDVNEKGQLSVGRIPVSDEALVDYIKRQVAAYGTRQLPIVIRGDRRVEHAHIRRAMNICTEAGVFNIKFAALREQAAVVER